MISKLALNNTDITDNSQLMPIHILKKADNFLNWRDIRHWIFVYPGWVGAGMGHKLKSLSPVKQVRSTLHEFSIQGIIYWTYVLIYGINLSEVSNMLGFLGTSSIARYACVPNTWVGWIRCSSF